MSTLQGYIKNVKLSGYKSIKNLECSFNPGLNIIIGDNGSGKSNFFEFLKNCLLPKYDELTIFSADFTFINKQQEREELLISSKKKLNRLDLTNINESEYVIEKSLSIDGKRLEDASLNRYLKHSIFLQFGLPDRLYLYDEGISLIFEADSTTTLENFKDWQSVFLRFVFLGLSPSVKNIHDSQILYEKLKIGLYGAMDSIMEDIICYTPVQEIKLSKSLRVEQLGENRYRISNIVFEYKVNDEWLSFAGLSDGTKRLIYLISEVSSNNEYPKSYRINDIGDYFWNTYMFIEEPEIGIHPHQLHQLMNYLKEMSRKMQIFISTHSPQVLDILNEDELDNLILASIAPKAGTTFRHLDEKEKETAQLYMRETGYLSDYWQYSDLQRTEKSML